MLSASDRARAAIVYRGPIRSGGAESGFEEGYVVKRMPHSGLVFLDPTPPQAVEIYQDKAYWSGRYGNDEGIDFEAIRSKLEPEQIQWLERIGRQSFENRVVADIGAGSGLFLNLVSGIASATIGIELSRSMRSQLKKDGHEAVKSLAEVADQSVDVCVTFDVLEHSLDPIVFLADANRVLKKGGKLYVGVPNQNDFLKELCPGYLPFFYHKSHLFYFTHGVLTDLLGRTSFAVKTIRFVHKYNFMNMVNWLRDSKPTGNRDSCPFGKEFEASFRSEIERSQGSSHILIEAEKLG